MQEQIEVRQSDQSAPLEKLARALTPVSVIAGVFLTVNTVINTVSRENEERHTRLREAIATEENFWKDLYEQYLEALSDKDETTREARLFAVQMLAGHVPPNFTIYSPPLFGSDEMQTEAKRYFENVKKELVSALSNPRSSTSNVAVAGQNAIFNEGEATVVLKSASPESSVTTPTPDPTTIAGITYDNITVSNGAEGGWDVDVFWCVGDNEQQKFFQASQVAARLASAEGAAQLKAKSVELGRIRVRPLPLARQGVGYPNDTNEIRYDGSNNEINVAQQINDVLNIGNLSTSFQLKQSASGTSFYLSAFVCAQPATLMP